MEFERKGILARLVYLEADLTCYCSVIFKSRMTLVIRRIDVFREMTLTLNLISESFLPLSLI